MIKRKVYFTLDCSKPGSQFTVEGLHVGDKRSCELHILLRNGIIPLIFDDENIAVIMNAQKPDGTTISTLCDISEDKKEVLYTLDVQDTAVEGIVAYQLIVAAYDGENYGVMYSASFSTVVSVGIITPVFKKLESQPENWTTEYKKYFRKTENGYEKISDDTCPAFNSDDFYFLVNPNYDSENDYSAFEETVANVTALMSNVRAILQKNTEQDAAIALKADKLEIPTKTSQLQNDSGFLTEHQSLADYYNKTSVNSLLDGKANVGDVYSKAETDTLLTSKADKSEIPSKTSDLNNDSGFVTSQDISGKEDKSNKVVSGMVNYSGGESQSKYPSVYAIREFLQDYYYNKQIIDDTTYDKDQVNSLLDGKVNVGDVYSKAQLDAKFNNKVENSALEQYKSTVYTKSETDTLLTSKADKSEIPSKTSDLNNDSGFIPVITVSDVSDCTGENVIYQNGQCFYFNVIQDSYWGQFRISSSVVSVRSRKKTHGVWGEFGEFIALEDSYYKAETINASNKTSTSYYPSIKAVVDYIAAQGFLTEHQSLADYYNKSSVNNLLDGKASTSHTHAQYLTSADIANKADKSEIPSKTSDLTNDSDYVSSAEMCDTIDQVLSGDTSIAPFLTIDNIVNATYNPNGDYILYYKDFDGERHNIFNISQYFAAKSAIPTKTSQLQNDSGFLTANAAAVNGNLPVEFIPHVGLINASDFSLYGVSSLGNYHAEIPVNPGEKLIINCRSVNSTYPGAFYTLNGVKVSAIFEDSGVTHLNAEITVPDGVDTLWLNNNRNQIPLAEWVVYKILTSGEYTEENNDEIRTLNAERSDEAVESMRRLKNLEALFSFRWKPFDKAYYCFVNDGSKNWVNIFYDVFHAHGVPFCAATIGENIELQYDPQNNGRTVKETLDLIVADGGEVMVYLNAAALKSTDPFELWYDYAVKNGKHLIESYGYKPRGLILSMNSARNSAIGQEICERFFDYADQVGTKPQYNIRRQQFSNTSTVDDVKAYIDSTANSPGFYPIMMHGTYMEPWASAEGMEEILSYIENNYPSTAAVSTYSHVFDTFGTNGFLTLNDLPIYNGGVV